MNLGMPEMLFIFVLALLIFGPKKLPEIGKQIGKAMAEFRRASNSFKAQLESEVRDLENPAPAAAPAPAAEAAAAPEPDEWSEEACRKRAEEAAALANVTPIAEAAPKASPTSEPVSAPEPSPAKVANA